jgi:hypothetical protein
LALPKGEKMKKTRFVLLGALVLVTLCSCAVSNTGWTTQNCADQGWSNIPLGAKLTYDIVWDDLTSLVGRQFEFDMLQKESGYIRTKWNYTWATDGARSETYRTRLMLKVSDIRQKIEIQSEAEKMQGNVWVSGCDTKLLTTMKRDIQGMFGTAAF